MTIFDLYSKRQKRERGEVSDIYTYDILPEGLKVQIVQIITDAIGVDKDTSFSERNSREAYSFLHKAIAREYGKFSLGNKSESDKSSILNFLLVTNETEKAIDIIELTFRYINKIIKENIRRYTMDTNIKVTPEDAIIELNQRFKEHAVGYQFDGNKIIRVDSTYTHAEIVKPTISLLWNKNFIGANEEYLKAHDHYRHGLNKECLTECLKAFESVMKIICKEKGWQYNETDTSKKLIQICFQNGLVPSFTQNQFTSLQNLLESGIPTIRNKLSGHGQGQVPQKVDDEMTRYALNLTGTNILFLVEQSNIK